MSKTLIVVCIAASSICAHAATIDSIISPTRVVINEGGKRSIIRVLGQPVYDCGLEPFLSWASCLA